MVSLLTFHSRQAVTRSHERGMTQSLYSGGTLPKPTVTGLRSMSFGSTRDFRLKCCRIADKSRNNSMRARPSPTHTRFPRSNNSAGEMWRDPCRAHTSNTEVLEVWQKASGKPPEIISCPCPLVPGHQWSYVREQECQ